jgi:hypothetical protein
MCHQPPPLVAACRALQIAGYMRFPWPMLKLLLGVSPGTHSSRAHQGGSRLQRCSGCSAALGVPLRQGSWTQLWSDSRAVTHCHHQHHQHPPCHTLTAECISKQWLPSTLLSTAGNLPLCHNATVCCRQPTDDVCCVLCAVCCVLCAVCCVLFAVCCVLCAVCCVLCAVCCVLCAVCCVLCAVCRVLCAVCCVQVPLPIREAVYDMMAANRYKLFGKTAVCQVSHRGGRGGSCLAACRRAPRGGFSCYAHAVQLYACL